MRQSRAPILPAAVVAVLAAAMVATASFPAAAQEPIAHQRVAGADRYDTAARLAVRGADPDQVDRVWLATGENFPDALAAGATGEPVVLVRRDGVPASSADALRTLRPGTVVAVGGPRAIAASTLAAAGRHAGARTDRISGTDRFATATALSRRTHTDGADVVWLATGLGFADALAAGPVAAAGDAPVLLVSRDSVPPAVRRELARLAPSTVVVAGGTTAITDATADAAAAAAGGATIDRIAGRDRYDTAARIARRGASRHGLDARVFVATGQAFPDALAAGPAALRARGPLVLTTREHVPEPTRRVLVDLAPTQAVLAGGEAALSRTVEERAIRPWLTGSCDLYDVTEPGPIQGHPEGHRPTLDAWSGPWVVDDFRGAWGMAVPYRWRQDKVEAFEHRGVLFYVDTEQGYDHYLSVTVLCGNPYLMGGDVPLDADDPRQIAREGPHRGNGTPDFETFDGPALYTAAWYGPEVSQRYDYVAVEDDVILIHYLAENRFARELSGSLGRIADRIAGSVAPAGAVDCPANASDCLRR